jgi:hypothetical protein
MTVNRTFLDLGIAGLPIKKTALDILASGQGLMIYYFCQPACTALIIAPSVTALWGFLILAWKLHHAKKTFWIPPT